jgi:Tfp pilus assembly protein PilE
MLHQFCPVVAKEFGVNSAIFLQNIAFWTQTNLANERNIYDGYCWTYNTLKAFQEIFSYFTKQNLETIINSCLKQNLIIKGNFNATKYDRTVWYALTPKAYQYFKQLVQASNINLLGEAFQSISCYQEMHFLESRNGFLETKKPIPDNKPDNKNNNFVITKNEFEDVIQKAQECLEKTKENLPSSSSEIVPYTYQETNLPALKKSTTLTQLEEINSLNLPSEFLEQLILIRKANKASVNKKAMQAVYQELIKLKTAGLDLNECLNMYANCGWKGFVAEWFINSMAKKPSTHLDHDSIQWGKDMESDPFYQNLDWIK